MFGTAEEMWDPNFWNHWYGTLDASAIDLQCQIEDQVEIGAPPIKTKQGWLLIYSYLKNYRNPPATFTVEAALLDLGTRPEYLPEAPILCLSRVRFTSGTAWCRI